jgi:hypothetical protein
MVWEADGTGGCGAGGRKVVAARKIVAQITQ